MSSYTSAQWFLGTTFAAIAGLLAMIATSYYVRNIWAGLIVVVISVAVGVVFGLLTMTWLFLGGSGEQ